MANQVVITANANGTVEFKRMNGIEILQIVLFSSCFQIDWNKAAHENVFDVFSGDNHFVLELREVDGPTTAQDLYDYLFSLVDCSTGGGSGGSIPNPLPITAASLPLPSGAATEQEQVNLNDKLTDYFSRKNIGKIFDLDQTASGTFGGYPLNFIDPPLVSIIFTAGINKDILTGLTASNIADLCSILNDVQTYFLFSVVDATKLLINDGSISINELQSIEFKTSNFGDMMWDAFADSAQVAISNVDEMNENMKAVRSYSKASSDALTMGISSELAQVASSISAVVLREKNLSRKELKIVNNSTAILYVAESSGASLSNWTWKLEPNEMLIIDKYNGIVTGIWDAANGFAQVTETV